MTNKKSWLGMLVITLALCIVLVGCDTGNGGDGDDSGGNGTLTITNLAKYNSKYIVASDNGSSGIPGVYRLIAAASSMSNNSSVKGVLIANGQAVLKVYHYQGGGDPTLAYTGSDKNVVFSQIFVDASDTFDVKGVGDKPDVGSVTVDFTSGNGTAAFVEEW